MVNNDPKTTHLNEEAAAERWPQTDGPEEVLAPWWTGRGQCSFGAQGEQRWTSLVSSHSANRSLLTRRRLNSKETCWFNVSVVLPPKTVRFRLIGFPLTVEEAGYRNPRPLCVWNLNFADSQCETLITRSLHSAKQWKTFLFSPVCRGRSFGVLRFHTQYRGSIWVDIWF